MNTTNLTTSTLSLPDADRVGVAASVLCAIHCALAPVLLLTLPAFGKIWAHPASHILVALLVVPLAVFSIRKGYRKHGRRWVVAAASIGILLVFVGAALPAFSKEGAPISQLQAPEAAPASESCSEETCSETDCGSEGCSETSCSSTSGEQITETTVCVDACCPSVQVTESGEMSLTVPPAAIVTTLGGIFLIAAHAGNLCGCGHVCRVEKCSDC